MRVWKSAGEGPEALIRKPPANDLQRKLGSAKFLHPRKSPSERRPGETTFRILLESNGEAYSWLQASEGLAELLVGTDTISIAEMVATLRKTAKTRARYTGKPTDYASVRLCRTLIEIFATPGASADTEADWKLLSDMGAGARDGCKAFFAESHADAIRLRNAFRIRIPHFTLCDLVCVLCLGKKLAEGATEASEAED